MRIGFDITAIPRAKSGVGFYVLNLLKALAKIDKENTFYIFSKKEDELLVDFEADNFHTIWHSMSNRLLRLGWEQTLLPRHISKYKLNIFHSPHYTVPLKCRVPVVTTFHDMTFFSHPEVHEKSKVIFFQRMIPIAAQRADAIIAVSESTKKDVVNFLNLPKDKVDVIYEGVDVNFYRPISKDQKVDLIRERYGLEKDFLLFVGTLEPRKNIEGVIKAFLQVTKKTKKQYNLVVGGTKGWHYKSIFELVQKMNLHREVIFTGYVPEEDLPYLFNAASVFVYPSFYEGFGIPPLEAMACGTPLVTSNISSLPEVVADAGLLVDPFSTDEIADAIIRVLTDQNLCSELARKGRKRAQLFSWEKAAKETLAVYRRVAENQ